MTKADWPVNLCAAADDLLEACEALAKSDDVWREDDYGRTYCCLCFEGEEAGHATDCPVAKARAAVTKAKSMPVVERKDG